MSTSSGWRPTGRQAGAALLVLMVVVAAVALWILLPRLLTPVRPKLPPTNPTLYRGQFPAASEAPLANPLGIAWTGKVLAVSESDRGVVLLFDTTGKRLGSIRIPVAKGAPKAYPTDLVSLDSTRLVVVDASANKVDVVSTDPTSTPATAFVRPGSRSPSHPTAVAVLGGEVLIADASDHDVKVYDRSGGFLRSIGGGLKPALGFVGGMVAIGSKLYVSDSTSGRTIVLDPKSGSSLGTVQARMSLPRGVAGDGRGRAYIADQFGQSIHVIAPDLTELYRIGGRSPEDGSLSGPHGIVWIPGQELLFVTDPASGRVKYFSVRRR